jgi:MFS family permease
MSVAPDAAAPAPDLTTHAPRTGWASLKDMNGYQWFVFIVCCLAWDMDCMDQQLFVLARRPAMESLVPAVTKDDARFEQFKRDMTDKAEGSTVSDEKVVAALRNADIGKAAGWATSFFLIGWSIGGIGFGVLGDRWGRVKTLMLTIGLYAAFTGLSALSTNVLDFYAYRLLTGLGVGGVFAASVTLLAETVPPNSRPFALGLFQASSVFGNCTAALLSMYFGALREQGLFEGQSFLGFPVEPWRLMFVVGIIPGLLIVVIQFRLREPEKWVQAVAARGDKRAGSYGELLGGGWGRNAVFGLILALSGVIGLWGIGFFSTDLQRYVSEPQYKAEAVEKGLATQAQADKNELPSDASKYINGQKAYWAGMTSLVQNAAAFFGIFAFSWLTFSVGRKPAFAFFFVTAGLSTAMVFMFLNSRSDIYWMIPVMGFFQIALFGGYAIYFPELFPTRLRSTGTSFCYNVGRFIAASGPALLGLLISPAVFGSYPEPLPFRYAGAAMCSIFGLGLVALLFLPETKDKPLPE